MLASLGVASAQVLLACGAPVRQVRRRTAAVHPEIRTWLHDAVATLRGAGFAGVHVLAVSSQRTTAAIDVLGAGVARAQHDGLVLTVQGRDGSVREQVTNDLTRDGIMAAVKGLAGDTKAASVDFGRPPPALAALKPDPELMSDGEILARVGALATRDSALSSRIVYASALMDIDDARVWSVAPGRDLHQRLVRVRRSISRVAWNGTRPVVSEATRAWSGGLDAQDLEDAEIVAAKEAALALMTPRAFEDREYAFALDAAVTASVVDAAVAALLTSTAARRPEVARRLANGSAAAAPLITLVDDPAAPLAYGGFAFDDAGGPPTPVTLIDRGQTVGRVDRVLRPGHVGRRNAGASHLRMAPGTTELDQLLDDGFVLEGPLGTTVDPASDRIVIACARARERVGGKRTGRMFADIELTADLAKLLASISAVSKQTQTFGMRDEIDGQARWRSIEAPAVRGHGLLRARRRPA